MSEFNILTERVGLATIDEAFIHWCEYHVKINVPTLRQAFFDFIDPVRQTDISDCEDNLCTYLTPTGARRVELMAGPHHYTYFKANADRIEYAHGSWGKQRRKRWLSF